MSQIIFLHGASSSGKSTIAQALQQKMAKPCWHISIDHLHDLFRRFDVLFAAVHCPVPELNARERLRGDRPEGSAQRDQSMIHAGRVYDIEIDSMDGIEANVQTILQAWRSDLRQSEFSQSFA
ncbi:chloramphenicol phosphotransferase CPT family protein [Ruegeria marisrubri]|uniref:phosphotransferase-like protein n=1 Tax=Ruegeria marisrubri TaxID=1685379 RepID=UPI001CD4845E|nr:zeta toxin family protein [Ruegeria marisrubri]MCA0908709.1 chloramphenicol phosphotransferase CPT family protein [Ruegeria marisrubri]